MPVKIFLCYAREDELLQKKLMTHLDVLRRQGLIEIWHDRNINAGTDWAQEIDKHLSSAQIILLLVSPNFIASDYCYSIEMMKAMERHHKGDAHVLPVILRPVYFQRAPFGKLQSLPTNALPITKWPDPDDAFYDVAEGIRKVVEQLKTFTLRYSLTGHTGAVYSVAITADGQILVSASRDASIKVWNLRTGKELYTLTGHTDGVWSVAISPNGQTLVSASGDRTIKMWNLQTGKELRTLTDYTEGVWSLAINADEILACASYDASIKAVNLQTGKELRNLTGHADPVSSVAISADGQTLVSGSYDYSIKVWNLLTGKELRTLIGHTDPVYSVAISPDGQTLVSGSRDASIKVWEKT